MNTARSGRRSTGFKDRFGLIIKVGDTVVPAEPFIGRAGKVVVYAGAYRVDTGVGNLDCDCSLLCGTIVKPKNYMVVK